MSDEAKIATTLVVLFLVLGTIFTSCSIVPPGHRGVRVTLGKVSSDVVGEGFALKSPWFIQKIVKMSIQQRTTEWETPCFSSDLQQVTVRFTLLWRVPEERVADLYQKYAGDPYESLVRPRWEEALKQATALHRAEVLVKERENIRQMAIQLCRKSIGEIILLADANLANIDLSDEVEKSIEAKVVQEQLALAKTFELQKERTEAEITVVRATAEAESLKLRGDALRASPMLVVLEMLKRWNGQAPNTVVLGGGATPMLPLAQTP